MLFKNETYNHGMYCFVGRRTYANRPNAKYWKAKEKPKPCIKNPDTIKCSTRHRQCENCPFKNFFKSGK